MAFYLNVLFVISLVGVLISFAFLTIITARMMTVVERAGVADRLNAPAEVQSELTALTPLKKTWRFWMVAEIVTIVLGIAAGAGVFLHLSWF